MFKFILPSIFICSTLAYPGNIVVPGVIPYAGYYAAAPLGPDGRVMDTPEVAAAKAQHEAAQINQRIKLANEEAKSADPVLDTTTDPGAILETTLTATIPTPGGAPLGPDGQVVDTPEVTRAKADHAAAQIDQRMKLAQESIRSNEQPVVVYPGTIFPNPVPMIPRIIYPIY